MTATLDRPFVILMVLATGLLACNSANSEKDSNPVVSETADTGESGVIPRQRFNIVMVVADSLRARSTSLSAGDRDTTPQLASWAANQVVFENAMAPSGWCGSSIASVFSGVYETAHGLSNHRTSERVEGDVFLDSIPTLPEILREAGYHTAGLHKSALFSPDLGWGQGFDTWEVLAQLEGQNMAKGSSAKELTDAAVSWLAATGPDPFFLYLHYMDPSAPYQAPDPWYDMFVPEENTSTLEGRASELGELNHGASYTAEDVEKLVALYEGEIAYWDSEFIRIPEALQDQGLEENTVLVVMSDHGEQFAEHDSWRHQYLWQENIHVPLVLSVPGATPGRVSNQVSLIDVAPTLSTLIGVPGWEAWQGADLSGFLVGNTEMESRHLFSEFIPSWAVLAPDGWKAHSERLVDYLHDLSTDPLETQDRQFDEPERMTELNRARYAHISDCYDIRSTLEE